MLLGNGSGTEQTVEMEKSRHSRNRWPQVKDEKGEGRKQTEAETHVFGVLFLLLFVFHKSTEG